MQVSIPENSFCSALVFSLSNIADVVAKAVPLIASSEKARMWNRFIRLLPNLLKSCFEVLEHITQYV